MAFGKRENAPDTQRSSSATATGTHIIPESLWQGKTGDFLRKLGRKPDDPSNKLVTAQDIQELFDHGRAKIDAIQEKMNAQLSAVSKKTTVKGYALIPDECWNGEFGSMLLRDMRLSPFDNWNIVFLPVTEEGALVLNQPPHPGRSLPVAVQHANEELARIRSVRNAAHLEAGKTHDFAKFADVCEQNESDVKQLAQNIFNGIRNMYNEFHRVRHGVPFFRAK
jgi:hypothetical protein